MYDYRIDAAAQVMNELSGFLKYVVDKKILEINGVHICHSNALSFSGKASLIFAKRLTLQRVDANERKMKKMTSIFDQFLSVISCLMFRRPGNQTMELVW
jgi:DNA transposition AAA+ family ATPase